MSAEKNNPQYTLKVSVISSGKTKKKDKNGWDHNLVSVITKYQTINFITDGNN